MPNTLLEHYISAEEQIETCFGNIDSSEPNWRNTTRDQLLGCEEDEADDEVMTVSAERRLLIFNEREDEYDFELKQPTIKSVSEAANMAEQMRDFAQFEGHQELSLALSKVNDILSDIKLRKPKQQTLISNYFSS